MFSVEIVLDLPKKKIKANLDTFMKFSCLLRVLLILLLIIIIAYIYNSLNDALSAYKIHIKLKTILSKYIRVFREYCYLFYITSKAAIHCRNPPFAKCEACLSGADKNNMTAVDDG